MLCKIKDQNNSEPSAISMLGFRDYSSGVFAGPRNTRTCGIYGIYCSADAKWYVGKSVNISHRLQDHHKELKDGRHKNRHMQNAFNKYGSRHFTFFQLALCDREKSSELEKTWIIRLNSFECGFNNTMGGDGGIHSEETKAKISRSLAGKKRPPFSAEWRKKMSDSQKKRTQPQETRDKISAKLKGRVFTDEWRYRMREGQKRRRAKNEGCK